MFKKMKVSFREENCPCQKESLVTSNWWYYVPVIGWPQLLQSYLHIVLAKLHHKKMNQIVMVGICINWHKSQLMQKSVFNIYQTQHSCFDINHTTQWQQMLPLADYRRSWQKHHQNQCKQKYFQHLKGFQFL